MIVYRFFKKKSAGSGGKSIPDQKLRIKFKRFRVYSSFKNNIWSADLADIQLISKHNKGFDSCYVSSIFLANKLGLKDKKGAINVDAFQSILNDSEKSKQNMGQSKQ